MDSYLLLCIMNGMLTHQKANIIVIHQETTKWGQLLIKVVDAKIYPTEKPRSADLHHRLSSLSGSSCAGI